MSSDVVDIKSDEAVSTSLVIINGFLVFFMQVGFLALETGSGRAKNVRNILLKNLLDVMLAAIVWWAVGYAFAYGKSVKGVIGTSQFFYEGGNLEDKAMRPWFFSWTFCIAACTIISGCLAERTALIAYPTATLVMAALVHPLLVHWIWNSQGFLNNIHQCSVLDFAGGMVVHMLGGIFGLVGAWKCGPRLGRFELLAEHEDDHDVYDCQDAADGDMAGQQLETGDLVDSASDLTSTAAAGPPPHVAAATAAGSVAVAAAQGAPSLVWQQQHQQQASSSRSLHTLLPSRTEAAAAACSSNSMVELGQVAIADEFKQPAGTAHSDINAAVAAAAAGASREAAAHGDGSSLQRHSSTTAGPATAGASNRTRSRSRGKLSSSLASMLVRPWRRSQTAAAAACGGGSQGACGSSSAGSSKWWSRLRMQRRRRRSTARSDSSTIVGRCGRGICRFVPKSMPGHDMAFVTLGTFMLWFGWFGFNNGSVYMYVTGNPTPLPGSLAGTVSAEVVQRTSMNTALGAAAAGLTSLLCAALFWGTYDLRICCNGVLSGLVIVTCMCGFIDPWAAVVCSAIAGALYAGASWLLLRCGVDDPLDSSAVHLGSGLLGSIMVAFVANPEHVKALTDSPCGGIFYTSTGWVQLGLQLLGIAVVMVFAGGVALVMYALLDKYGLLRVDQVTELAGIDNMEHGGPAYPEFTANWSGGGSGGGQVPSGGRRVL